LGRSARPSGIALLYVVFGGAFMTRFMPTGRPSTYDLVVGALAWTFALTAPAGFGLVGLARLATATSAGALAARGSRPRSDCAARSATTTWSPRTSACPLGTGSCPS
jgi:hypothetical protein